MPVQHRNVRGPVVRRRVGAKGLGHDLRGGAPRLLGEPPRIARRSLLRIRAFGIDLLRPDGGVLLGQQPVDRHRREIRIPVERLPVAKAEFQRLRHRVYVGRAVVPHRLEVEVLQDVQRLHQHRPLRPRVLSPDLLAVEGRAHRLPELRPVSRQVLHRQDPAHLPCLLDDQLRDGPLVECVPARLQALLSGPRRRQRRVPH